jgi:hypothetical protein
LRSRLACSDLSVVRFPRPMSASDAGRPLQSVRGGSGGHRGRGGYRCGCIDTPDRSKQCRSKSQQIIVSRPAGPGDVPARPNGSAVDGALAMVTQIRALLGCAIARKGAGRLVGLLEESGVRARDHAVDAMACRGVVVVAPELPPIAVLLVGRGPTGFWA